METLKNIKKKYKDVQSVYCIVNKKTVYNLDDYPRIVLGKRGFENGSVLAVKKDFNYNFEETEYVILYSILTKNYAEIISYKENPTIEQVKEYFKNAKEVRCLYDGVARDMSKWNNFFDNENGSFWNEESKISSEQVMLFDGKNYAEIISYKENPIQHDDFNEHTKEIIVKDVEVVTVKNDPIVSSVIFQLAQRSIIGQQKYGTTLQENNKDNFLQHLKEELMDAILYIEKLQSNDK